MEKFITEVRTVVTFKERKYKLQSKITGKNSLSNWTSLYPEFKWVKVYAFNHIHTFNILFCIRGTFHKKRSYIQKYQQGLRRKKFLIIEDKRLKNYFSFNHVLNALDK